MHLENEKSRKIFLKIHTLILNQPIFGGLVYFFQGFFPYGFFTLFNGNILYILFFTYSLHIDIYDVANSSEM